jgi:hypothetical protein
LINYYGVIKLPVEKLVILLYAKYMPKSKKRVSKKSYSLLDFKNNQDLIIILAAAGGGLLLITTLIQHLKA